MSKEKSFGVEEFAKLADIEPASARVMLRNQGVKKKDKAYTFKSKDEMQSIIDKARKGKKAADKKPAKKAAKKAVKKSPAKKSDAE